VETTSTPPVTAGLVGRAGTPRPGAQAARWLALLEREALPALVLAAFALVFTQRLAWNLNQDGWLALVGGREVMHGGLPSVDHLTLMGAGRGWVDQQWLGQLGAYGLFAVGGTRLLLSVYALIAIGAFAAAAVAARRLGGSARATGWVAVVCFLPMILGLSELRTQVLAFAFFVATFWLLAADARFPSARVFLVFPLLIVWANVHGSVVIGAGLVALAGVLFGWQQLCGDPRSRVRGWKLRSLALAVGPLACAFASPYGLSLGGYYQRTFLNPDFSRFVTEWRPTTPSWTTAPAYLLVIGGAWLLGRAAARVSLFERLVFLATAVGALLAVRNVGWLAFVALLVLPRLLDGVLRPRRHLRSSPLGFALVVVAVVGAGAAVAAALGASQQDVDARYRPHVAAVVTRVLRQDPTARVFADVHYADWLLWRVPAARGRVAYDARLELLSHRQLQRLYRWSTESTDAWKRAAAGYSVAVLDVSSGGRQRSELVRAGARVVYADSTVAVLTLPRRLG
jgi:hypothetical protein